MSQPTPLSADDVRKVAALSRLTLSQGDVEPMREKLSSVLGYVQRLAEVDVSDVEPLTHVGDTHTRMRDDTPGPALSTQTLMDIAPQPREHSTHPPFIRIPKVLGDGGGA
jgi:aspartyl-tRNA(Asn)/glutamyl-tRNA(Gln) amidotransferase subunit C